jgi:molecular chaperone DnaK
MPIIGIDLGTSNSAAACCAADIIRSAEGITLDGKAFPSYVALTADGQMERLSERQRRSGTPQQP